MVEVVRRARDFRNLPIEFPPRYLNITHNYRSHYLNHHSQYLKHQSHYLNHHSQYLNHH